MKHLLLLTALFALISGCGDDNPTSNNTTESAKGTTSSGDGDKSGSSTKMPDGKVWMTKNLDVETADSWCYGEGGPLRDTINMNGEWIRLSPTEVQANCKKYGRLYTWDAAKTACPEGFHLPSYDEWWGLTTAAGGYDMAGKRLKSKSGWNSHGGKSGNGTDEYRFSALPGGRRLPDGTFNDVGRMGLWWTDTEQGNSNENAYRRGMDYSFDIVDDHAYPKGYGFSVRCIQDNE